MMSFRKFARIAALAAPILVAGAPASADERADAAFLAPLLNRTLETERSGTEIGWRNPATGNAGSITVERTFYRGQQPCREYVRTTGTGAAKITIRGTGCRVGKERWALDEAAPAAASGIAAPAAAPATAAAGGSSAPTPSGEAKPEPPLPSRKPAALVFTMPPRSDL